MHLVFSSVRGQNVVFSFNSKASIQFSPSQSTQYVVVFDSILSLHFSEWLQVLHDVTGAPVNPAVVVLLHVVVSGSCTQPLYVQTLLLSVTVKWMLTIVFFLQRNGFVIYHLYTGKLCNGYLQYRLKCKLCRVYLALFRMSNFRNLDIQCTDNEFL